MLLRSSLDVKSYIFSCEYMDYSSACSFVVFAFVQQGAVCSSNVVV